MNLFALFDTGIGRCGVAWSVRGLLGVQLPEQSDAATRTRLQRLCPAGEESEPSTRVRRAIEDMQALLSGEKRSLRAVTLDMAGVPDFNARVYETTRAIAPGLTRTYGHIARAIGQPHAARAVGQALGRNQFAIVVPCHRVLGADGRLVGFSANGGLATKMRMLEIEGVFPQPMLFDALA